jgi:hypothetical protein
VGAGIYVAKEWFDAYGMTLSTSGGYSFLPRVFNTSDPGRDPDLGAPNRKCFPPGPGVGVGGEPNTPGENCEALGNVLIIQEDNDEPELPDDPARGGTMAFEFITAIKYVYEIGIMDIERNTTSVTVVHKGGISTIDVIGLGDNAVQIVLIDLEMVFRITVNFATSGAVTYLAFCL